MVKVIFVVETRRRRPGQIRWQPWRLDIYEGVSAGIRWARAHRGELEKYPPQGWEVQARVVPFDRRKKQ